LLPPIEFQETKRALAGFTAVALAADDPVGTWYLGRGTGGHGGRVGEGLAKRWAGPDRTVLWQASATQVSALRGLRLPAGRAVEAVLVLALKRDGATAVAPRVTLEQHLDGKLIAGSTFQIGYDRPPNADAADLD
jgi:hypothetical protein